MKRSWAGALFTSCFVHAAALATGAWLLTRAFSGPARVVEVTLTESQTSRGIELPTMAGVPARVHSRELGAAVEPEPEPREAGRAFRPARPDLEQRGRGGVETGARVLGLVDEVADVALDRDAFDGRRQSQVARLATDDRRRSRDNRRATPNPMQLTFVATGPGHVRSRQPNGPGRVGSLAGVQRASREGATPGEQVDDGWLGATSGTANTGSVPSVSLGSSASGNLPGLRARVTHARPAVTRARAAVPAHERGRAADTTDSEAKVASTVKSLIQAGGLGRQALGVGGETGPDGPGRDGSNAAGARATPSGTARDGVGFSRDTGLGRYNQRLLSRIDWRRAFPTWAIAEGRGGLARIGFTVQADGQVTQLRVIRPSGIPEFDRELIVAVRRGAPYGPLPPAAGGRLQLEITFDALNPAVGREGPGPGARRR